MKKYYAEVISISVIFFFIAIIICGIIIPSQSELVDKAMKDGRWDKFQDCIDPHPSDVRCDSCWNIYILQKPNKNNKYK